MPEEQEGIKPVEGESKKRVLLVDDEESIRRFLGILLRKEFDVVMATNGREAWQKLNNPSETFDLLITDKDMPEASGLEVLQRIRGSNESRLKNMPAIMMSGNLSPQVKRRVEELGAQTIEKPILDLKTLVEMAKSALKTSEAPTE